MENISLDQYIKNKKSTTTRNGSGSGGRARRLSSDTISKGSPRKLQIRNTLKNETSSPVKFTARLDTTSTTSNRGGVKSSLSRPPRSKTTTTTTTTSSSSSSPTTSSSNIANPPPLKITIQNSTFKKEPRIDRQSIPSGLDGRDLPRIKITKTVDRNSSIGRPIIRSLPPIRSNSNGRTFRDNDDNNNNNNNNSPILSGGRRNNSIHNNRSGGNRFNNINNDSDYLSGNGPSLFERSRSINNNHHNTHHHGGQTGKNLQLFTGSRLNISNLHHAISENDLRVLFDSIGDIKQIKINYDHSGRSDGTGFVIFSRHNDAMIALKKYDGAQLDGKPLRINAGPSLQEDVRNIF